MNSTRCGRACVAIISAATLIAACGGSDDSSSEPDTTDAADATTETTDADSSAETEDTTDTTATTEDDTASGDFEPGDVGFRVVNLLDEPVDIYVRTSGIVEAFTIAEGVEPAAVTDLVAPPTDGVFLVTEAGGGDPTCVSGCDHFIAELSAVDEQGPVHTVVLYTDASGAAASLDLWEQPPAGNEGTSNAMPPTDPASGVVVVTGIALTGADFGLRLAIDGTPGCLEPFNLENILVGGNQTPAFTYEGDTVELVLHDNTDRECAAEPVGGPFTVDGGPGSRSHLILTGSPGSMGAVTVPMLDGDGASSDAAGDESDGEESAGGGDRDLAVELMTAEVEENLGLPTDQSECVAGLLVDAIGVDTLLDGDQLVDLDSLPEEFDEPASQALVESIDECGVDPAVLGG